MRQFTEPNVLETFGILEFRKHKLVENVLLEQPVDQFANDGVEPGARSDPLVADTNVFQNIAGC